MTFQGPDPELWERYSRATNAPVVMELGIDGVLELNQRVIDARTWDGLAPADQALLEQAELQISAGLSPTLQHPDDWSEGSDWSAEDAALDADPEDPDVGDVDDDEWVGIGT